MKKKTILITGSSGFIGYFFLEKALAKKYHVVDILRAKNRKNKKLNYLKKKNRNSYKSIFYKNLGELKKKLETKKFNYFINFATLYKSNHFHNEIPNFIESNIIFPSIILDIVSKKIKKIVNIGTMMQHVDGRNYSAKNFYASTKSAFEMILNFYSYNNKKLKYYNLKLYESFAENDNRKKLIPTMKKNFRKNLITRIVSKNLELNVIHVNDILNAIFLLLKKNISSGNYSIVQKKNIKIRDIIKEVNKKAERKLKIKYLNKRNFFPKKVNLKTLPNWKPDNKIKYKIINEFSS